MMIIDHLSWNYYFCYCELIVRRILTNVYSIKDCRLIFTIFNKKGMIMMFYYLKVSRTILLAYK